MDRELFFLHLPMPQNLNVVNLASSRIEFFFAEYIITAELYSQCYANLSKDFTKCNKFVFINKYTQNRLCNTNPTKKNDKRFSERVPHVSSVVLVILVQSR